MERLYTRGVFILFVVTSNNRQTGVNILALVNRALTPSVKCFTFSFCVYASRGLVTIMNQPKSVYNSSFTLIPHSHLFSIIANKV